MLLESMGCLQILALKDCSNLTKLPINIDHLSRLQQLNLNGRTRLQFLPQLPLSLEIIQVAVTCKGYFEEGEAIEFQIFDPEYAELSSDHILLCCDPYFSKWVLERLKGSSGNDEDTTCKQKISFLVTASSKSVGISGISYLFSVAEDILTRPDYNTLQKNCFVRSLKLPCTMVFYDVHVPAVIPFDEVNFDSKFPTLSLSNVDELRTFPIYSIYHIKECSQFPTGLCIIIGSEVDVISPIT
ncbi:hypothetical protein K1719_009170 [Acacia pycnantha]|nr:hypothetical protein K1719_009170 [Acacia pycnantha]